MGAPWAWLVIIVLLAAIGTTDVLHAMNYTLRHRPTEGIVAAAPVVAVLLAFSLLLTLLRQSRTQAPEPTVATPLDVPAAPRLALRAHRPAARCPRPVARGPAERALRSATAAPGRPTAPQTRRPSRRPRRDRRQCYAAAKRALRPAADPGRSRP